MVRVGVGEIKAAGGAKGAYKGARAVRAAKPNAVAARVRTLRRPPHGVPAKGHQVARAEQNDQTRRRGAARQRARRRVARKRAVLGRGVFDGAVALADKTASLTADARLGGAARPAVNLMRAKSPTDVARRGEPCARVETYDRRAAPPRHRRPPARHAARLAVAQNAA